MKNIGGKIGYEKDYNYDGLYFVVTAVGRNGFIVSAYPLDNGTTQKYIRRYKNERKN